MKVTFSSTHNAFQVTAPKGTLISLSTTPTELGDGVYIIGDDGVINIDDQFMTDTIYLSTAGSDYAVANGQRVAYPLGDDSVIVRAGGSAIPFKVSGKGGDTLAAIAAIKSFFVDDSYDIVIDNAIINDYLQYWVEE